MSLAHLWQLDPDITFLNHGSFGACPTAVLARQRELIARMEAEPVRFVIRELEPLLDAARAELAAFVGAGAADLVFVPNATAGVNTVLRSLRLQPGDELLTTNHAYNACRNALEFAAERSGAKVRVATVPFPVENADRIAAPILNAVTPRTRLVLLDHVTSPTALVFPVEQIVRELAARNVDVLIDGAHGPGMLPLRLDELGAAYYAGNCHKWLCAPKGASFLHVRRDRQSLVRPLSISHGANSTRTDRSRYHLEFDWTGTDDFSPYVCIADAIRVLGAAVPGGWPDVQRRNHELALAARELLCQALRVPPPCPAALLGSMAAVPLPASTPDAPLSPIGTDPIHDRLFEAFGIEVPIVRWSPAQKYVRVSAQLYNERAEYEKLAAALLELTRESAQV